MKHTPLELRHEAVSHGEGNISHREFIVDSDGKMVSGTIGQAIEITKDGDDRSRDYAELVGIPHFESGEPYPHSKAARDIVQAVNSHDALVTKRVTDAENVGHDDGAGEPCTIRLYGRIHYGNERSSRPICRRP